MWLDNLIELKKKAGKSCREIAEGTFMPERTVIRIFHRETDNPSITTLIPIINFLGGSFDEIFADTKAIVGDHTLVTLRENIEVVSAERDLIIAENAILKEKVTALTSENELLKLKLIHKDELLALHNYYNKLKTNDTKGEL